MTAKTKTNDADYMAEAIALGQSALGQVSPNPGVGCVLVQYETGANPDGRVVGRGVTQKGGRPHGEAMALSQAGMSAQGAVAYVSLEPCAHVGETQPCADALIAAGVARVVSALEDPDPRVAGRGHQRLRDAGVQVEVGLGADAAFAANIGFITRIQKGRPHVHLKLAVSSDNKISARQSEQTAVSGPEAGQAVHRLRALSDAVLVGQGTWEADDPQLTCRLPEYADRSPVRIVLDARAELPLSSKLVQSASEVPVWAVVSNEAPALRLQILEQAGVRLINCPLQGGHINLGSLMAKLGHAGLTRLLVEGGGKLSESLLLAGLVDELTLIRSSSVFGADGVPAFGELTYKEAIRGFDLYSDTPLGADNCLNYRRAEK